MVACFFEAIGRFKARHATVIGPTAGNIPELADFPKEQNTAAIPIAAVIRPDAMSTLAFTEGP